MSGAPWFLAPGHGQSWFFCEGEAPKYTSPGLQHPLRSTSATLGISCPYPDIAIR